MGIPPMKSTQAELDESATKCEPGDPRPKDGYVVLDVFKFDDYWVVAELWAPPRIPGRTPPYDDKKDLMLRWRAGLESGAPLFQESVVAFGDLAETQTIYDDIRLRRKIDYRNVRTIERWREHLVELARIKLAEKHEPAQTKAEPSDPRVDEAEVDSEGEVTVISASKMVDAFRRVCDALAELNEVERARVLGAVRVIFEVEP